MAWNWGISIIIFAFGLGSGFFIAYLTIKHDSRVKELEEELSKAQVDHTEYRGKVSQHFEKTAELFEDMTERYRAVYQHMASSAQTLCEERPPALQLDIVDRGRLSRDMQNAAAHATASAVAEDEGDSETEDDRDPPSRLNASSRASDDNDDYLGDAPHVPELTDEVSTPDQERSNISRRAQ